MKDFIKLGETLEDLQTDGYMLIQKEKGFRFGVDAVLLADFAPVSANVLDIGTGTGIIPILLAARDKASKVIGLEIQSDMADMAERSVLMNHLQDKIDIQQGDINNWQEYFKRGQFDCVVTNPPYMEKGTGVINPTDSKAIARHEILCSLNDIASAASAVLRVGGSLSMVHRPHRLADIIEAFRLNKLEPKLIRMVYSKTDSPPAMVLINAVKNGNRQLKFMPNLYIFKEDGSYSDEINKIYKRQGVDKNE